MIKKYTIEKRTKFGMNNSFFYLRFKVQRKQCYEALTFLQFAFIFRYLIK